MLCLDCHLMEKSFTEKTHIKCVLASFCIISMSGQVSTDNHWWCLPWCPVCAVSISLPWFFQVVLSVFARGHSPLSTFSWHSFSGGHGQAARGRRFALVLHGWFSFFELDLKIEKFPVNVTFMALRWKKIWSLSFCTMSSTAMSTCQSSQVHQWLRCLRLETVLFKECLASAVGCAPYSLFLSNLAQDT